MGNVVEFFHFSVTTEFDSSADRVMMNQGVRSGEGKSIGL